MPSLLWLQAPTPAPLVHLLHLCQGRWLSRVWPTVNGIIVTPQLVRKAASRIPPNPDPPIQNLHFNKSQKHWIRHVQTPDLMPTPSYTFPFSKSPVDGFSGCTSNAPRSPNGKSAGPVPWSGTQRPGQGPPSSVGRACVFVSGQPTSPSNLPHPTHQAPEPKDTLQSTVL